MTPETEQQYKNQIAALQAEIEKLKNQQTKAIQREKYGLNWIDVPEEFDEKTKNSIPVLIEDKRKAIKNADGNPTHILIEGDNYHALTCLNYTHAGKIDVIYIDPPYNTGSDGFTYKDARFMTEFPNGKTVPKDDPLRHSTWLSFMEKRLRLAKNLLSDKGVIFISIDDNEQANLKLLCDQIFGEKNFVNQFIWQRNSSGKTEKDKFTINSEYVLFYKKSDLCILNSAYKPLAESTKALYKRDDNDGRGKYRLYPLQKPASPGPETTYDYVDNNGKVWKCPPKGWRIKQSKLKELENDGRLCLENSTLSEKAYWNERESEGKRIDTLWTDLPENTVGTSQLSELFENKVVFSNPKPTELIRRCLQINTSKATILDFFAGSGTTLHATMKLNAEDGGNRQCILVQQQENDSNICETITYERNRRVIQGYTNTKGEEIAGLGNSLKYYKTDFIGENDAEKAGDEDKITLAQKAGYLISLVENTLEEIETNDFYQIFSDAEENQFTAIYFNGDTEKFPDFVQSIQEKNKKTIVYIFTWGSPDIFENEFDDLTNITIKSIPQPILEIYKSLMKNGE